MRNALIPGRACAITTDKEDMMQRTVCALVAVALGSLSTPCTALAVDGQVAISQARAMAGGVTPGDAPGFPVSINLPGSYVLATGLTVPDANTRAIEINADHVTVDLNGFSILGPTVCSGDSFPCANSGAGIGIFTPAFRANITIRRGTIQGMGQAGVILFGGSHLVEFLHVRSNGVYGMYMAPRINEEVGNIVQHNTVQRNGLGGMTVVIGIVADNIVSMNGSTGIALRDGIVRQNVVNRHNLGLDLLPTTGSALYVGNALNDNQVQVVGGHNGGQNLCGIAICP